MYGKMLAAAVCLSMIAAEAHAISRYDPTRMSCGQVHAAVRSEGAVILRYRSTRNPGLSLYDRYVRSGHFCNWGERTERASVPTVDRGACPVLVCRHFDIEDELWWKFRRRH